MLSVNIACNRRCSVYLNNVGCALMKRGAFADAMKTFSDSVFVMKQGVTPFGSTQCCDVGIPAVAVFSSFDLQSRIKRADQRMAFPQVCKMVSSNVTEGAFEILEPAEYPDIDIDELLRKHDHHMICPIRIETDLASSANDDNADIISGIMLFNLGLSYSCLSKCDSSPNRQELRAAATRIFQLADCIVHRILTEAKTVKVISQNFELWKLGATTAMAVLHSLFQLFVDRRGSDDMLLNEAYQEVYHRLCFLQDNIYMNECGLLNGLQQCSDSNGAAAA